MRTGTLAATVGLILLGAVASAQNVTYDFDKSADFSKFRTYVWVQGTHVEDELNHKRIVYAIDTELRSKGLIPAEAGASPDMLVAYHATFERDLEINGFSSGWGGYRFGGMRSGTATVDKILIGTLAVDLVDAGTSTIVWRGMATREIDVKASPEKRDKNISKAAEKLFSHYPPGKK